MSLYDDLDLKTRTTENVQGWSSGIKLLQSQMQLKKATVTQPKREATRKASLAPVIDLKTKREEDEPLTFTKTKTEPNWPILSNPSTYGSDLDWNVVDEYDPLWPNEYEKEVKDMRDRRERDRDRERERDRERDRPRDVEKEEKRKERRRKSRFNDPEDSPPPVAAPQMSQPPIGSGFAGTLTLL